jgi:hypothetical protein
MEGYEVEGGGDLDNRAAIDMQYHDGLREGRVDGSAFKKRAQPATKKQKRRSKRPNAGARSVAVGGRVGDFEKHTLGVGRKLMERQGWTEGSGLGSKLAGISRPVAATGNAGRAGLGYSEEPAPFTRKRPHDCKASATKSGRTFHISTVYDEKGDHEGHS